MRMTKEEMIEMLKKAEIHLSQTKEGAAVSIDGSEIALKAGILTIIETLSRQSGESMKDILQGFMAAVEIKEEFMKGNSLDKDNAIEQVETIINLFRDNLNKQNGGGLKN